MTLPLGAVYASESRAGVQLSWGQYQAGLGVTERVLEKRVDMRGRQVDSEDAIKAYEAVVR
jgi:hypothetical protein